MEPEDRGTRPAVPPRPPQRWTQFTLSNLFYLTLGLTAGFAPLRIWEYYRSPTSPVVMSMILVEAPIGSGANVWRPHEHALAGPEAELRSRQLRQLPGATVISRPTMIGLPDSEVRVEVGGMMQISANSLVARVVDQASQASPATLAIPSLTPAPQYLSFGNEIVVLPSRLRNGRFRIDLKVKSTIINQGGTATAPGSTSVSTSSVAELVFGDSMCVVAPSPQPGKELIAILKLESPSGPSTLKR
ncbi:MAG: hypothetical protein KDB14_17240 [Planctomycetales bacterium]|nr:hypothetical protein [Planctomycetales bacterium]